MTETNVSTTRVCKACGVVKSVELFPSKIKECHECLAARAAARAKIARPKSLKTNKDYYAKNRTINIARAAKWAQENKEKRREITKRYSDANPEKRYAAGVKHRTENPGYYRAHFKMRQTRKKLALSAWADLDVIEALYVECSRISKETGIKHHVDHYYPLKSDVVCGLHNEFNLRIIPAYENLLKHNHFPDED